MQNWIDKKSLITGVVTGIILFLLYKHFTKTTQLPSGEQKVDLVLPK